MSAFRAHEITLGELLERLARERPERDALVYPDRGLRLSFADLEAESLALARGLIALGIEPGERVTLWSDNRPDWIPFQFALARIGVVLVTANTALTKPEIRYLLEQSRSCAVIAAPGRNATEYREALSELRATPEALPELRHWIELGPRPEPRPREALGTDELRSMGDDVPADEVQKRTAATHPEEAINIQYTSGTTGFPKGVVLSHRNIVENAYTISRALEFADDDRLLLQVPLFHCFGCAVLVLGAYTHGLPVIATQTFDPAASLRAIHEEGCTVIHGVPTMFLALLSCPEFADLRPTTLRKGAMGGAACPEPLMRRVIAELNCGGMLAAYGMTESSPGITCSHPDDPVEIRCSTVGRALPGIEVRIVDPGTLEDCASGERGELWTRGPHVMLGYFENEEATTETITPDGWLRTGDLATRDEEGLVRIVGRIKEMIIRGGENVYPTQVEDALRTHPAVRDAAVFGLPHERLGEEVACALILEPDTTLAEEAIALHLKDRLAPFKRPSRLVFVDSFPMTPSGKVQKFRLAENCSPAG